MCELNFKMKVFCFETEYMYHIIIPKYRKKIFLPDKRSKIGSLFKGCMNNKERGMLRKGKVPETEHCSVKDTVPHFGKESLSDTHIYQESVKDRRIPTSL